MRATWNLETALPIIRAIDPIATRCNFSLALRGSVLIRGESDSDLDLCFLCEETENSNLCSVERVLQEIMSELHDLVDHRSTVYGGSHPHAVIWLRDRRHIDAHFWLGNGFAEAVGHTNS
jgi:hypothetical protein